LYELKSLTVGNKKRGEGYGGTLRNGLMRYPGIYCLIKGSTFGSQPKAHVKVNVCNTILLIPTSNPYFSSMIQI
jgi:hypothetical protein